MLASIWFVSWISCTRPVADGSKHFFTHEIAWHTEKNKPIYAINKNRGERKWTTTYVCYLDFQNVYWVSCHSHSLCCVRAWHSQAYRAFWEWSIGLFMLIALLCIAEKAYTCILLLKCWRVFYIFPRLFNQHSWFLIEHLAAGNDQNDEWHKWWEFEKKNETMWNEPKKTSAPLQNNRLFAFSLDWVSSSHIESDSSHWPNRPKYCFDDLLFDF